MKNWFKYFLYLSLVFLLVYLIRADYLSLPEKIHWGYLSVSLVLLGIGFLFHVSTWQHSLLQSGYPVTFRESMGAVGLSVFGKYIPGKIWIIVGRAGYVAKLRNYSSKQLSSISLNTQFITLWVGLIIGTIGLYLLDGMTLWGHLIGGLWLLLTAFIFTDFFHRLIAFVAGKIMKRNIVIPRLSIGAVVRTIPWFTLNWLFWCASFYFMIQSIYDGELPYSTGLGFSLAATLGIVAIIAPGGLGVREGVLAGYLALAGIDVKTATTIAVFSRLWFLVGEVFIFVMGLLANWQLKKQHPAPAGNG